MQGWKGATGCGAEYLTAGADAAGESTQRCQHRGMTHPVKLVGLVGLVGTLAMEAMKHDAQWFNPGSVEAM